jgi:hypothetical protein
MVYIELLSFNLAELVKDVDLYLYELYMRLNDESTAKIKSFTEITMDSTVFFKINFLFVFFGSGEQRAEGRERRAESGGQRAGGSWQ